MVRWIVGSSQKFRLLVLPVAALLLFIGLAQVRSMPADVLPEFTPPTVQIQTEALGLSAVEVEQLITVPLEQDLLNGVPWLDTIRSTSTPGLSQVDLVFLPGTEVIKARQVVAERLTQAVALPHVSKAPMMIDQLSSTSRVMIVGLSSTSVPLIDLSVLTRWQIKPRLQGLPGVANVSVWGQRERQLQVQVNPKDLTKQGVTLNQVVATTGNALWVSPLTFIEASTPGAGGFIETPGQRLTIQHVLPITTAADLAKVPVEGAAGKRLGDVAQVVEDHQPLIGDGQIQDKPALLLVVEKAPGADTLQVTTEIEEALEALKPGLSGVTIDTTVYRPATYIESGINNVAIALLAGLVLVVVLLGLLFLDWRTALISLVALPLSATAAVGVLNLHGDGLNVMVIAGVVAALGVLIDDIVVDADILARRLRAPREAGDDRSTPAVLVEAIAHARSPVMYATLILLVAAAPLLLLSGVAGLFTRSMAMSYALAIVASLLVALIVTPALALTLFARVPRREEPSPVVEWLRRGHSALVGRAIRWPYLLTVCAAVLVAAGAGLLTQLSGTLLPRLEDRNVLISWTGPPGTSQAETMRVTALAGSQLRALPEISNVGVHIGRAVTSDQISAVSAAQLWVTIKPDADYDATTKKIQTVVEGYPGFDHRVMNYPERRISQLQTGADTDITVRLYGKDLDGLYTKAAEIQTLLGQVTGVVAPTVDLPPVQPTIEIEANLAAAERYGLKPGDVRRAAAIMLSGLVAGSLFEDQKVFDVVVLGVPAVRDNLTTIQNLQIDTPSGGHVLLKDVADVRIRSAAAVIEHDAVSRRIDVRANVSGRGAGVVAAEIREKLASVSFPAEYHAEVLNWNADRATNRLRSWALVAAATLGVLLLLQAAFGRWRLALVLLLLLLLAPVGGVVAARFGGPVSLGSLLGLLAVWALALRNGVQLIAHYQRLEHDGEEFGPALVMRGTRERFGPILKSALATAAAVAPMVALGDVAGLELIHPMAIVFLGGLVTSTLANLFVLPALYLQFGAVDDRSTDDRTTGLTDQSGSERDLEPDGVHGELTTARSPG